MEPVVIGVIAVLALVALVAFFVMRGRGASKPEELPRPAPRPATKPAEAKAKPGEPERPKKVPPKPAPPADAKPKPPSVEDPSIEPEPAIEEALEAEPAKKKGPSEADVKAMKKGLASTRGGFIARLAKLFGGKKEIDPALLDEIQEVLITADLGVKTSEKILDRLKKRMDNAELSDEERIWDALREEARTILGRPSKSGGDLTIAHKPTVILVVGVNGVGKTTTIGKLASRYKDEGKEVVLAAGDTFRAAAVLQLQVWGRKTGCEVVHGKPRADPASVIFDAISKAKESGADVVIADTAGRLHTKSNLMEELKKVTRTAEKALERPVDHVLLVLDSTTGQNAIQQAQLFKDAIDVSGIALTKLDGTAKGGVILGIVDEHELPVHFVGIGERVEDLRAFDAGTFVEALFAKPDDETLAA